MNVNPSDFPTVESRGGPRWVVEAKMQGGSAAVIVREPGSATIAPSELLTRS